MEKQCGRLRTVLVVAVAGMAFASANAFAESDWIQELQQGCDGGNGEDCANLGAQLRLGQVVSRDLVGARAAFEKGCQLDSTNACVQLYKALSFGEGGPKDPVRARELAGRVCNTGIIASDMYLEAHGLCAE